MSHLPPLKAAWCETCQAWQPTDHHHPSEAEWRERLEAAEARAERLMDALKASRRRDDRVRATLREIANSDSVYSPVALARERLYAEWEEGRS